MACNLPWILRAAAWCVASLVTLRAGGGEPSIRIEPVGERHDEVVVTYDPGTTAAGLSIVEGFDPAKGAERLPFFVVGNDEQTPMLGTYRVQDGRVVFQPRLRLSKEAVYAAFAYEPGDEPRRILARASYALPTVLCLPAPQVTSLTPGGDEIPANVLRFYVTFSRPMREGRDVLERIRLLEDRRVEVAAPWRDLELWNADATRLSLFVHPGRIKQGVNLRVELGAVMEPGKTYTLVVGPELRDAEGTPMHHDWRRTFTATDEVRERIDVAQWRLVEPAAGTTEPLAIEFGRLLDDGLTRRCLTVRNAGGAATAGRIEMLDDGRRGAFTPEAAWKAERYVLVVDPVLEDVCGNTPLRPFDVDLEAVRVEVLPPVLRREFTPR